MPNLRGKTWTTTTPANVGDAQYWEDHLISDSDNARIQSAVQSVNGVYSDDDGNVEISTVPEGGLKDQVLMKFSNESGDAGWGYAGHVIEDVNGFDQPHQKVLQFLGADVLNDTVNQKTVVDCHGEKGDPGKSAYQYAIEGGYTGTEQEFYTDMGNFAEYATTAEDAAEDAEDSLEEIRSLLAIPDFTVDFETGELTYSQDATYSFNINTTSGNLEWEVV